jgi:hypothetical protein
MTLQRRTFLARSAAATAAAAGAGHAHATLGCDEPAVIEWNQVVANAIAATSMLAPMAARAFAMVNEALYNAWAAYDWVADFTLDGIGRRPFWEFSSRHKVIAISHAAHGVALNLFPTERPAFDALLQRKTSDGAAASGHGQIARSVGQTAAARLLAARLRDGANQLGDLAPGAYSDYTGYRPVNGPDLIVDISRWQPLRITRPDGTTFVQTFLAPHWQRVRTFALPSGSALRPTLTPLAPTVEEMLELIAFSAALDDRRKAQIDFWAANPGTVSPPGQWIQLAMQVSDQDRNDLDRDVKLFFTTSQALLDASIAAWDAKRYWDNARPITAIPYYFRNQHIRAWGGPGLGTQHILGQAFRPFQRPINITPNFPDFVSGHSTFSAAAAAAIGGLRGSDHVRLTGRIAKGSLRVDPGFPTVDVDFAFNRLTEAADSAGLSRRLSGIHFRQADLKGGTLGRDVGNLVVAKCRRLFAGTYR